MAIIISGPSNDILVNGSSVVTEAEAIGLAPTTSPTFTGTVTLPSTTSIGAVSSTELGYLDGVTSNIQTQLNALNSVSLGVGAVGTYAFLGKIFAGITTFGQTVAGSNLRYAGVDSNNAWSNADQNPSRFSGSTNTPSGTWMCMGTAGSLSTTYGASLWLRIA